MGSMPITVKKEDLLLTKKSNDCLYELYLLKKIKVFVVVTIDKSLTKPVLQYHLTPSYLLALEYIEEKINN